MFKGVNASDGIGIGVARVAVEPDLSFTPHAPADVEAEKARYAAAITKFVEQTRAQIERMKQTVGEESAAIMGAHIEFAEDDGIKDMVNGSISAGMCAEQAVCDAYDTYYTMFSQMEDERAQHVQLHFDEDVPVQADGEPLSGRDFDITILPSGLRVIPAASCSW